MSTNHLRILIVDDNKDHQLLMQAFIEESIKDVYVDFSDTGKDCLLKLSEETYSMLIIDFSLSETNGLELFRNIIQKEVDIPVIMVTGFGNENVAVEAMKLGAYDYIVKSDAYLGKLPATILKVVKEHELRKEKKEVEKRLIESELRYRTLIEDVIDIVFMMDKELNIVSINPACQRIFECSEEDVMKKKLYELVYGVDREMVVDYFKRLFLGKRELVESLEFRIETKKGNTKHVEMNAKVNYGNGDVMQIEGVIRDVTERKKIEQRLYQMDKLNALELQSNGIAHEFNNILGIILGYLNILKLRLDAPNQQVLDTLRIIERAAKDGAEIVDKIQQFSKTKPENEGTISVDMFDVINEAVEFTMPRWKSEAQLKGIEYEVATNNLVASRYYVKCNPSELREVVVNIINNSIDAMPDGGKIEFSAKVDNGSVILSISDNGIGINEDIKDKIFDPFFSTKDVKRSGLGMSVVHSIVKRYNGVISIDSRVGGKGVTIYVKMPLCLAELTKREKKKESGSDCKADILIIEDEEVILDMMKIILEKRGHKVFIAKDSSDGMKMYENNRYDVVLCDLAMPKVNGWKVAKHIKDFAAIKEMAKTPFVLITGYELDTDSLNYKKEGVDFILKKPLEFDELNKMINNFITEEK